MTSRKGDPAAWAACRGNPKLHAAVESHPNVEKHDVRMGHPAAITVDDRIRELVEGLVRFRKAVVLAASRERGSWSLTAR